MIQERSGRRERSAGRRGNARRGREGEVEDRRLETKRERAIVDGAERETQGMKGRARDRGGRRKRVYRRVERDGGRRERRAPAGMRRDGRRRCMRKNFTREPANPRERFTSSARLPAVSVSCAIPYAALGEATTVSEHDSRHALADISVIDRTRRRVPQSRESRDSGP